MYADVQQLIDKRARESPPVRQQHFQQHQVEMQSSQLQGPIRKCTTGAYAADNLVSHPRTSPEDCLGI
jgi:hypothetical protein